MEVKEVKPFSAETAENHEDVEKIWSVKALHHAEIYFNIISSTDASKLRLTRYDDEIYVEFKAAFPEINVNELKEIEDFKTDAAKEKWREWVKKFEGKIVDFNYGTLLRTRAGEDYGPENAFFVIRIQFLAIEVARNREGFNNVLSRK
ncbi:polysaccharide biosynthesis domain containing protein 1 [Podochytrium sp. JEL0797]|nr:polysaccharide biosynthesis domain containing protein 1 [Podochytrium sp. JEL0797]